MIRLDLLGLGFDSSCGLARRWARLALALLSATLLASSASAQVNALRLGTSTVPPDTASTVRLSVDGVAGQPIGGVSFGVALPPGFGFTSFSATDAEFVGELSGPDFVAIGLLFSSTALELRGPGFFTFGTLTLSTPSLSSGTAVELPLASGLGSPPVPIEFATVAGPVTPITLSGGVVAATPPASQLWIVSSTTDEIQPVGSDGVPGGIISGPAASAPSAAAVDANGIAWIPESGSNRVRRFGPDGTEVFVFGTGAPIETGPAPNAVALDRFGNAWITQAGDDSVSVVDAFGRVIFGGDGPPLDSPEDGVLGSAIPLATTPTAVAADPFGSVWVTASDTTSGRVLRINRSGLVAFDLDVGVFDPVAVAVDRMGFGWIAQRAAGRVERRASDGSIVRTYSMPGPFAVAVRRKPTGGREGWAIGSMGADHRVYRLQTDGTIADFDSPSLAPLTGVTIDGAGRPWLSSSDGTLLRVDPDSTAPTLTVTAMASAIDGARIHGDATGYTQAAVQFPDGNPVLSSFFDFDADGFVNLLEIQSATDVFDAASAPMVTVAPVVGLACDNVGPAANVSWSNPQSYDEVRVHVQGSLVETLAGSATSTSLTLAGAGTFLVEVSGVVGSDESDPVACTLYVGTGEVAETTPVIAAGDLVNPFDVAVTSFIDASAPFSNTAYVVTDPEARRVYRLDANQQVLGSFSSAVFSGDFGASGVAFDPFGAAGDGTLFLSGGREGAQVEIVEVDLDGTAAASGAHLFVEDGSGPIEGRAGSLAIGQDGGGVLLFVGPDGCEIFALLATGTGEILPDVSFVHPTGTAGAGLNGVEVFGGYSATSGGTAWITSATSTEGVYEAIEVTAAASSALPTGNAIPLAGIEDENVLGGFGFVTNPNSGQVELSIVGVSTSSVHDVVASPLFIRGDANGDGAVDIGDPIAILGVLFQGDPLGTCMAALDGNGDTALDIADAIYLLSFLFAGGTPPPAPYPAPGGAPFECSP